MTTVGAIATPAAQPGWPARRSRMPPVIPATPSSVRQSIQNFSARMSAGDAFAPPIAVPPRDAAFAGFWWSHVARRDLPRFLAGVHSALAPGARIVFSDNRYVAGSSTPVARTDADGDTWQARTLADGSRHEVLKNFPEPAELEAAVRPHAAAVEVRLFDYYWWLEYTLADAPR